MDTQALHFAADILQQEQQTDAFDYRIVLMQNHETTIAFRNGEAESLQQSTARSLALNLMIDGRDGFFYTNNTQPEELEHFIRQAILTTRILEPDPCRSLADSSRYYRGDGPELRNCDHQIPRIDPIEKIKLVQENQSQVQGSDSRIISAQTRYSDRVHRAHYLISNGFQGYEESSRCSLSTILTMEGDEGQHPMDGWGETRIFFRDMPTEGIADIALQRTRQKIGQRPTHSGNYTLIVESPVAGHLLQPLLTAMSGQALQGRMSFLADQLGKTVLSPQAHLVDDPLIPGTRGACHFDYDGVATQRRTLFDHGTLETYFIDTPHSKKLGIAPTTQGIHHLIMEPGTQDLQGLMKEAGKAIVVTDFNGGNCDPATGNFSYGIEGYLVENGQPSQPISGMNITGNMLGLWQRLVSVGNDSDPWETELIPSLTFEGVQFGGI